jgi:hypothetical protein
MICAHGFLLNKQTNNWKTTKASADAMLRIALKQQQRNSAITEQFGSNWAISSYSKAIQQKEQAILRNASMALR